MKAIGWNVIFAWPLLTNSSITWGIDVSDASLQIGHEVSPYSTISTGASGSPIVVAGRGHALEARPGPCSTLSMLDGPSVAADRG